MSNPPAAAGTTTPGTVLASKYRVERVIGQGGMGLVVVARHVTLDERVALKFLLPEYATHPEASARFLREARAAVKIKSEHVARVSDVGTLDDGAPYMVMEFLEGRDLAKLIQQDGVLAVEDAVDYVIQGCDALAEAHGHGIIHRDVKPANLFLTQRPNGTPLVKVLDFGISKITGNQVDNLTKTAASMGSALYMSPEQMQQTRAVDHRTDIYALGISLYELLAGKQPFYADTLPQLCAEIFTGTPTPIRSLRQDVPEGLARVLEKAYARARDDRHQSIGELVVALAPYAPRRSQPVIESVTKMAGLNAPVPTPPPAATPLPPPQAPGGTQILESAPVPRAPAVSDVPAAARQSAPGVSVVAPVPASSSRAALVAVALVALLGLGGGGAYLATRGAAVGVATPAASTPATPAPLPTAHADTAPAAPEPPTASASSAPIATPAATAAAIAKGPRPVPVKLLSPPLQQPPVVPPPARPVQPNDGVGF